MIKFSTFYDGEQFFSRLGNPFTPPDWFLESLLSHKLLPFCIDISIFLQCSLRTPLSTENFMADAENSSRLFLSSKQLIHLTGRTLHSKYAKCLMSFVKNLIHIWFRYSTSLRAVMKPSRSATNFYKRPSVRVVRKLRSDFMSFTMKPRRVGSMYWTS